MQKGSKDVDMKSRLIKKLVSFLSGGKRNGISEVVMVNLLRIFV